MALSLEERAAYLASGGLQCPKCKSDNIAAGAIDMDGPEATSSVSCMACNAIWIDVYRLHSIKDDPAARNAADVTTPAAGIAEDNDDEEDDDGTNEEYDDEGEYDEEDDDGTNEEYDDEEEYDEEDDDGTTEEDDEAGETDVKLTNREHDYIAPAVPPVFAKIYSDDYVFEFNVDVTRWFTDATDTEILELAACDFGGDTPADRVAEELQENTGNLADLFSYLARKNTNGNTLVGFECHVDPKAAMAWLATYRPALHNAIKNTTTEEAEEDEPHE